MTFSIKKIGIIGAGQMGNGIAHICAKARFSVHLLDSNSATLSSSKEKINQSLDRAVQRGQMDNNTKKAILSRISFSENYSNFSDCELVIEAATEREDVKVDIINRLCSVIREDTLIASNTSSISITRLGARSDRPEKFVGMHFMNPVPRMELVEIIRGIATDEETYATIRTLAEKLGKQPVSAEDFPAFIVNRILLPMINEAIYTLYEGVGSVKAIDTAMKLGTHHPMGPLELADFIGLDTCLSVMHVLHEGLADTKYRPCPLLVKYVEAGWLGKKTNRGFYDYSCTPPEPTR